MATTLNTNRRTFTAFIAVLALPPMLYFCGDSEPPASPRPRLTDGNALLPRVYFLEPNDGEGVTSPLSLSFAADNFAIEPANNSAGNDHGHFHLMIDAECMAPGTKMPSDVHHRDLVRGENKTMIELQAGPHDFCLQAASGDHTSLDVIDRLHIEVVR